MEANKAENMIEHEAEIYSRPARTWFQTERQKKQVAKRARDTSLAGNEEEDDEEQAGSTKQGALLAPVLTCHGFSMALHVCLASISKSLDLQILHVLISSPCSSVIVLPHTFWPASLRQGCLLLLLLKSHA